MSKAIDFTLDSSDDVFGAFKKAVEVSKAALNDIPADAEWRMLDKAGRPIMTTDPGDVAKLEAQKP